MALHVDTKNCAVDAPIRQNSNLQYHLGVMMMALGIGKLDDKTLPEFLARLEFYQRLSDFMQPDEAAEYARVARESVGVWTNVTYEREASWVKHVATSRFRSIVSEQAFKAKQPLPLLAEQAIG